MFNFLGCLHYFLWRFLSLSDYISLLSLFCSDGRGVCTHVCVRACVYFRVSYRYCLIYDCWKLGMISFGSLFRAEWKLPASPPESLQRMLWVWMFISILWIYNFCLKKKKLWKAITQHDKSSVLKLNVFSTFLLFSLPSPYLWMFVFNWREKLDSPGFLPVGHLYRAGSLWPEGKMR